MLPTAPLACLLGRPECIMSVSFTLQGPVCNCSILAACSPSEAWWYAMRAVPEHHCIHHCPCAINTKSMNQFAMQCYLFLSAFLLEEPPFCWPMHMNATRQLCDDYSD